MENLQDILDEIRTRTEETKVKAGELEQGHTDEYGVMYSKDGSRLLKVINGESLTEYFVKEGTEIICDEAFNDCVNLQSIILPSSVKSIGARVFVECRSLKDLSIPESVTWISSEFIQCFDVERSFMLEMERKKIHGLQNIKIQGVNYEIKNGLIIDNILHRIVYNTKWHEELEIPEEIIIIDKGAFYEYGARETLILPASLKVIGDNAFWGCGFKSLYIPDSVEYIGKYALCLGRQLNEVNIPKAIETIGDDCFNNVLINKVTFPKSLKKLGKNNFNQNELKEVVFEGIPEVIAQDNFHLSDDSKIIIPDSSRPYFEPWLHDIGQQVFYSCELEDAIFTDKFQTDESGIVYSEDGKKLLFVSHPLKKQGWNIEDRLCPEEYVVREGTEIICADAFHGCKNLKKIILPKSLKYVGESAFERSENLRDVEFNKGLLSIGPKAFKDCKNLTTLRFPETLTTIRNEAFMRCNNLNTIDFGENVCYIGDGGFSMCTPGLTQIELPKYLIVVQAHCFHECTMMESVKFNDKLKEIEADGFSACLKLTNLQLPDSLETIGDKAFRRCLAIQEVSIPESVTYIGEYAFESCENLSEVTLPRSIEHIAKNAFYWCENLQDIKCDNKYKWDGEQITEL